jgi:hypothetical protein
MPERLLCGMLDLVVSAPDVVDAGRERVPYLGKAVMVAGRLEQRQSLELESLGVVDRQLAGVESHLGR